MKEAAGKAQLTVVAAALLIAWALKQHYSDARAEEMM